MSLSQTRYLYHLYLFRNAAQNTASRPELPANTSTSVIRIGAWMSHALNVVTLPGDGQSIVKPGPNQTILHPAGDCNDWGADSRHVDIAGVDIKVFHPRAEIVGDGSLKASADRPCAVRIGRIGRAYGADIHGGNKLRRRTTRRGVEQVSVKRVANPAP